MQPVVILGDAAVAQSCGCRGSARRWCVRPWAGAGGIRPANPGHGRPAGRRVAARHEAPTRRVLPLRLRVHRARSGHPAQAAPKVAHPVRLIVRVSPLGQVAVPAAWSTVKSSTVNPPGMTLRHRCGLDPVDMAALGQFGAEFP